MYFYHLRFFVCLWRTGFIFYDTKVTVMNRVLNATVQRTADHAAPEITLDPLEIVGGMHLFHFLHIFVLRPQLLENNLSWALFFFKLNQIEDVSCFSCFYPFSLTFCITFSTCLIKCFNLFFRWDQIIREHIFLPGSTSAVLCAFITAVCQTGQWGWPNLCF